MALVHSQTTKAASVDVGDYIELECLAVKLVGRRARSVLVACIYRPPGPVSSAFTDQLCQLLDQLVLLNTRFVIVVDFNTPDDIAGQIHHHVDDVFNIEPGYHLKGAGEACVGTSAPPPTQCQELRPVPHRHTGSSIRPRLHCWKSWTVYTRQPMTSK